MPNGNNAGMLGCLLVWVAVQRATTKRGDGFVFRAYAGLTYRTSQYGNIGVGVSWVTFPSGQVRSAQPYLMYEYPFY